MTTTTTTTTTAFTTTQSESIERLRGTLQTRVVWPVTVEYGVSECGLEHWAALVVQTLPRGSYGLPGPLVSIVTRGCPSGSVGVMDAKGRAIDFAEIPEAMQTAGAAGVLAWNAMAA